MNPGIGSSIFLSFSLFSNLCKLSTNNLTQSEGAWPKNPRTQSGQLERVRGSVIQEDCSNNGSGWGYSLTDRGPKDSERFGNQSSHFDHPVQGLYDTTEKPIDEFSDSSSSTTGNRQSPDARPRSSGRMSSEGSSTSVVGSFGGGCSRSGRTEGDCGVGRGGDQSSCSDRTGQNLHHPAEDTFNGLTLLPCPHQIYHECALRMIQKGLPFCHHCWMPLFETPSLE